MQSFQENRPFLFKVRVSSSEDVGIAHGPPHSLYIVRDRRTKTDKQTVTLAAHARRGFMFGDAKHLTRHPRARADPLFLNLVECARLLRICAGTEDIMA